MSFFCWYLEMWIHLLYIVRHNDDYGNDNIKWCKMFYLVIESCVVINMNKWIQWTHHISAINKSFAYKWISHSIITIQFVQDGWEQQKKTKQKMIFSSKFYCQWIKRAKINESTWEIKPEQKKIIFEIAKK